MELNASDFRQTGSRSITNSVERELVGTGEKALLDVEVDYVTTPLKQVAALVEDIPNALLESSRGLRDFLNQELSFALNTAIDQHVIGAIEESDHPFDAVGETLIERVRFGIAAQRGSGYAPSVLAVDGNTAADLDLAVQGTGYVFPVQTANSSSPLFGQQVVEVSGIVDPLLIDPAALGVLVLGGTVVDIDATTGFSKNTSTIRAEARALFVVRNSAAVYELAVAS